MYGTGGGEDSVQKVLHGKLLGWENTKFIFKTSGKVQFFFDSLARSAKDFLSPKNKVI